MGTFILTDEYYFQFREQALDCNFDPLANAFVTVRHNDYNRTFIANSEGYFDMGWYLCAETGGTVPFELRLADINTGFVSPWLEQELLHDMDFSVPLAYTTPEEDFIENQGAGGYVAGIFSGTLVNNINNQETPLNGRFRIRQP